MEGFLRVAAVNVPVHLGDVKKNALEIEDAYVRLQEKGVQVALFPELALTGYTLMDMLYSPGLLGDALIALLALAAKTKAMIALVSLPVLNLGRLYVGTAVLQNGRIQAIVAKKHLSGGETRWFHSGIFAPESLQIGGESIPFGLGLLFCTGDTAFAIEICEDVWTAAPPSAAYAKMGAEVIFNPAASTEIPGKNERRKALLKEQSARCLCGYVYASSGYGESTNDSVFSGFTGVYECGDEGVSGPRFSRSGAQAVYDLDLNRIRCHRQKTESFFSGENEKARIIRLDPLPPPGGDILRRIAPMPFIPSDIQAYSQEALAIAVMGLQTRMEKAHVKDLVIGVSGGLDSALALLVCAKTIDEMNLDRKRIHAVTMPGFGTGSRTKGNAVSLLEALSIPCRTIPISASIRQHFQDIGQDEGNRDVTFENAQARERTQILMDIANQVGGLVVGTGDLSESALGFCTYNGDHMSMYSVNASIPKTLMRAMVLALSETCFPGPCAHVLRDIVLTPVSPELLPGKDGEIGQKTEEILGDYALHDFFLYHLMDSGAGEEKLFALARTAFDGVYDSASIHQTLNTFLRRFYSQQFKRSCSPDGAQSGPLSLSPRGAFKLPSDMSYHPFVGL